MLYAGELVAKDNRSTERPYRVALGGGFAVDAAKIGNETRAINSIRGIEPQLRANICFKSLDNNVWVVARRRIAAGAELLGDYSFPSQPRSAQDEAREVFSDDDGNDNECGKVGCTCDDTELVCCDSCPAAFHHSCLRLVERDDASGSMFMCRDCKIDQDVHDNTCKCGECVSGRIVRCEVCPAVFHPECLPRGDNASCETYICRECVGNAGVARYKKGDSIEFNYAQKGKWYPGTVMGTQLGKLGWCFSCKGTEAGGTTWEVRDIEGDDLRPEEEGCEYGASSKRKAQGANAIDSSRGGRGSSGGVGGGSVNGHPVGAQNKRKKGR